MATWTWFDGKWHDTPPAIATPMTHAMWLGSCVFDGARAFENTAPDLHQHCQRVVNSANTFGLRPQFDAHEIEAMARDGIAKFGAGAELYIRPMYWAAEGFVDVDPETTRFSLSVYDAPMPAPTGFSVTCSPFRRPSFPLDQLQLAESLEIGQVVEVLDRLTLRGTGLEGFASNWFAYGSLVWTTGVNAGLSAELSGSQSAEDDVIKLWQAMPELPTPGDQFVLTAGCDKSFGTCRSKFANGLNFRGCPHMPGTDFALSYASGGDLYDGSPLVK